MRVYVQSTCSNVAAVTAVTMQNLSSQRQNKRDSHNIRLYTNSQPKIRMIYHSEVYITTINLLV